MTNTSSRGLFGLRDTLRGTLSPSLNKCLYIGALAFRSTMEQLDSEGHRRLAGRGSVLDGSRRSGMRVRLGLGLRRTLHRSDGIGDMIGR